MRLVSIETRSAPFIEMYQKSARAYEYDLVLTPPNPISCKAFEAFCSVYRHYSDNPYNFELNCFRRYFEALQYVEQGASIIIADTDQLLLSPPEALPEIFHLSEGIVGSRGISNGVPEFDISPHFSKWSAKDLRHFTEFLVQTYRERSDKLEEEYLQRRQRSGRAAISDMTLFNMFIVEESVSFHDSNSVRFERYVDHNFSMSDASDGSFRTQFGFKSLKISDSNGIELYEDNGRQIFPATIHLQGRAKIVSQDIYENRLFAARAKFFSLNVAKKLRKALSSW